jgi:hypothetical protein
MDETRPSADAPWRIARPASSRLLMQQILTRGLIKLLSLRRKRQISGVVDLRLFGEGFADLPLDLG